MTGGSLMANEMKSRIVAPLQGRAWKLGALAAGILLCGGLIGSAVTATIIQRRIAGRLRHPERLPFEMVSRMRDELGLSPEQEGDVLAVLRKHQGAMIAAHNAAMEGMRREVEALLDDEQAAQWRGMNDRRPGPPDPVAMARRMAGRLRDELELTDEQAASIEEALEEFHESLDARMWQAVEKMQGAVEEYLTEEQRELWKKLNADPEKRMPLFGPPSRWRGRRPRGRPGSRPD